MAKFVRVGWLFLIKKSSDINGDCIVNFKDFALMALHWLEQR
jgi:hypothetical protein